MHKISIDKKYSEIDRLNLSSYKNRFAELDTALANCEAALDLNMSLAVGDRYKKGLVDSLNNVCWFKLRQTAYEEAQELAEQAHELAKEIEYAGGQARALGHLGRVSMYWGNYAEALDMHYQQFNICNELNLEAEKSTALTYLGHIYSRLDKPEDAIESYKASAQIDEKLGDKGNWAGKLVNIGMVYSQLEDIENSLAYSLQGLELAKETNNMYSQCWALGSIAKAYRKQGKLDETIQYLEENYALSIEIGDEQQQLDALIEFGKAYLAKEKYAHSIDFLKKGIDLANKNNFRPHLVRCYETISYAYQGAGQYKEAFEHFKLFHELEAEIFSLEVADKEAEILRLKTSELEKMVDLRTQELTLLNNQLNKAVAQEKDLNHLKSKIMTTVSHEFRTPLSSIKVSVDMLKKFRAEMTDEKRETLYKRIDSSINGLSELIEDILSVDAIDPEFDTCNILPARYSELADGLKLSLFNNFGRNKDRLLIEVKPWGGSVKIDLFQVQKILFHLVDNGLKFSPAGSPINIEISVDEEQNYLHLQVSDRGIGINLQNPNLVWEPFFRIEEDPLNPGLGLGLFLALQSTRQMGGELTFTANENGAGTTFILEVPIN